MASFFRKFRGATAFPISKREWKIAFVGRGLAMLYNGPYKSYQEHRILQTPLGQMIALKICLEKNRDIALLTMYDMRYLGGIPRSIIKKDGDVNKLLCIEELEKIQSGAQIALQRVYEAENEMQVDQELADRRGFLSGYLFRIVKWWETRMEEIKEDSEKSKEMVKDLKEKLVLANESVAKIVEMMAIVEQEEGN